MVFKNGATIFLRLQALHTYYVSSLDFSTYIITALLSSVEHDLYPPGPLDGMVETGLP